MRTSPRIAVVVVALVAAAAAAHAAPPRTPAPRARAQRSSPDVFGGYSWTRAGEASLHGWAVAGSLPYSGDRLQLVAELSGHSGSFAGAELDQLALMAGARRGWSRAGVRPFAEALFGFARTSVEVAAFSGSDTDWGIALGGGADYPIKGRWAVRALAHLRLLRGEGALDTDPRLSAGVVYQLK